MDIEFIAQALQLISAQRAANVLAANTGEALSQLIAAGGLPENEGQELVTAWRQLSDLNHILRISTAADSNPDLWPAPLKARLASAWSKTGFAEVEDALRSLQTSVRAHFVRLVGPPSDGMNGARR